MKIIYQCDFCGEKFQNDEKTALEHEANCEAKHYNIFDRVEVFYEPFDLGKGKWLKGTITHMPRSGAEGRLALVVRMDERWYEDTDGVHNGYDMWIPNDGAPSIFKNVRRLTYAQDRLLKTA